MAIVIWRRGRRASADKDRERGRGERRRAIRQRQGVTERTTHVFQDLHFPQDALDLLVVLALELAEHGIAVLAPAERRQRING